MVAFASTASLGVLAGAVVAGAAAGAPLVRVGLRQLSIGDRVLPVVPCTAAVAAGGAAAAFATERFGSWWLLPALLAWGYAITACAVCDALTQRVPTPLVRQAIVLTVLLLALGGWLAHDERHVVIAFGASACAGLIMLLCWRFLGAGFGDVRLGLLGGLGLGHASGIGLAAGVAAFAVTILAQTIVVHARHGRGSQLPYGPSLVAGFLVVAAVPLA